MQSTSLETRQCMTEGDGNLYLSAHVETVNIFMGVHKFTQICVPLKHVHIVTTDTSEGPKKREESDTPQPVSEHPGIMVIYIISVCVLLFTWQGGMVKEAEGEKAMEQEMAVAVSELSQTGS